MWIEKIVEACKASGLSHAELARIAGVHRPQMTRFLNHGDSVHFRHLEALCGHLGLTLAQTGSVPSVVTKPVEAKPVPLATIPQTPGTLSRQEIEAARRKRAGVG